MTKKEFLLELQRVLNGRIGSREAANYVSYYQEYIEIEVRKGRDEEEVTKELGSPRLIGKNVADVFEQKARKELRSKAFLEYKDKFCQYGAILGRKCAVLCRQAAGRAKGWFGRL